MTIPVLPAIVVLPNAVWAEETRDEGTGGTVAVMSLRTVREVVAVDVEAVLPAAWEVALTEPVGVSGAAPVGDGINPREMATETGHTVV